MASAQPARVVRQPVPIDRRAADNLRFIRDTMENAASFTAVPGWGGVVIGASALVAGLVAMGHPLSVQFSVWLIEAILALLMGVVFVRWKSKRVAMPLQSRPARRALLSFVPPLLAGAVLDRRSVSNPATGGDSGPLVDAVWRGRGHRRRILSPDRSGDGPVLHALWRLILFCAAVRGWMAG